MKFKIIPLLFIAFNLHFTFSQNLELSILTIPDSLTQNANSVVRSYNKSIELASHKKMYVSVKKAVTVLNKLGDHESKITVHYDKNTHINSLKVLIYDAMGNEIKKVSKGKFEDYAAVDGISLHNDGRVKHYRHVPISYPYTIYYESEVETSNTAFIPRWMPADAYNQSVENSTFKLTYSSDLAIQKSEKLLEDFSIQKEEGSTSLSYTLQHQPAVKYEEYSPRFIDIFPSVKLASNKFHLEGFDGSADSWQDFGKWMYSNLIANRGEIPEATKNKVKALVAGIEDPIEKARKVYEFVQNKTRYISVQVGIGGWMPMLASDVDRLAYGDCKALTNYTKVLLDAVGVESYYTAVHAGSNKRDMENDVVSVQGNHVFLYVPSKEKDYWLECTSQTTPFGYQGSFTDDRDVFVISPEGGKIVHTPAYDIEKSLQHTTAKYSLDEQGNLKGNVTIASSGLQYKNHYYLEKESKKDLEEYYKSDYWNHLNNLTILKTDFTNNKKDIIFSEKIDITAANYANMSGERMLVTLNAFNRYGHIPKRYRSRKQQLQVPRGYYDKDEYEIHLPKEFVIESLPEGKNIETKFGVYDFKIEKINEQTLKYTRNLLVKKGLYAKENYKAFRKFKKQISKNDNAKLILIKS